MRIVIITFILCFILTACNTASATPSATDEGVGVTVVVENTATATIIMPTSTPAAMIENCPDAPPIRLILQERGRVSDEDERKLNLRDGPGLNFEIIYSIEPDEFFFVLDGPTCADEYTWFRVQYGSFTGWIAEGDSEAYYVEPYLPG